MITREFEGLVLKVDDTIVRFPANIVLSFDPDFDPLAVQMIIEIEGQEDAVWYFGRELLQLGVNSYLPVGSGDIKFRYAGTSSDQLLVCLRPLYGHADLGLPQSEVIAFLNDTIEETPLGAECLDSLVDEALEEILGA